MPILRLDHQDGYIKSCFKYLYACARCKQASGELFLPGIDSLFWPVSDTVRRVPIRFCSCRVVSTLATAVGAELLLRFWGPRSKLLSSSWSNTFIMGIYPNVSARIYIVMSHPYKLISTFFRLAALESGQSNDRLPQCLLILINSLRSNGAYMCQ